MNIIIILLGENQEKLGHIIEVSLRNTYWVHYNMLQVSMSGKI